MWSDNLCTVYYSTASTATSLQYLLPGSPLLAHDYDHFGLILLLNLMLLDFPDGTVTCDFFLWKVIRCLLSFPLHHALADPIPMSTRCI